MFPRALFFHVFYGFSPLFVCLPSVLRSDFQGSPGPLFCSVFFWILPSFCLRFLSTTLGFLGFLRTSCFHVVFWILLSFCMTGSLSHMKNTCVFPHVLTMCARNIANTIAHELQIQMESAKPCQQLLCMHPLVDFTFLIEVTDPVYIFLANEMHGIATCFFANAFMYYHNYLSRCNIHGVPETLRGIGGEVSRGPP